MSTASQKATPDSTNRPPKSLVTLVVLFVALLLAAALSEGVYDIAFANLALDLSGLVSTIGLVYCAGYGVEVAASLALGPLLDRRDPRAVLVVSFLLKISVFVLIGLGSSFLASRIWVIVAAAAAVDFVHQVGQMALFVLLPRLVDEETLVKVQGIGASARAASQILSPVVAGLVISVMPGAHGLIAAAGFQTVALLLLMAFTAAARSHDRTPAASTKSSREPEAAQETEPAGSDVLPS
ncbi:MFS transporter, partial [Streptomyces neyagawaensis]